jgi:hypothetical protein
MIKFAFCRKVGVQNNARLAVRLSNHFGKSVVRLGAKNHIDIWGAADNFFTLGLSDATPNSDNHPIRVWVAFFLDPVQSTQFGIHLFSGPFANVTGI